jgi:hypothetical protein
MNIMNKTKIALTIVKLLGIAVLLAIALTTTIFIEGLQIIAKLIQNLNEVERLVIAPIQAQPLIQLKSPKSKYQWMIDLLPRDYLTVKHLKAWAKERRIKHYSKLSKSQLVLALSPALS